MRTTVDFTNSDVADVNAVLLRSREDFLDRMGLSDLLTVKISGANS